MPAMGGQGGKYVPPAPRAAPKPAPVRMLSGGNLQGGPSTIAPPVVRQAVGQAVNVPPPAVGQRIPVSLTRSPWNTGPPQNVAKAVAQGLNVGKLIAQLSKPTTGDVNPLGHPGWGNLSVDMGVDANAPAGTPIVAPNNSVVTHIDPNWYSGQPQVTMQLTSGPNKGKYWYVSEQIQGIPQVGQQIPKGHTVATYAPSGTGIEIGWAADPNGTTLSQAHGTVNTPAGNEHRAGGTPEGQQFLAYMKNAGKPQPTSTAQITSMLKQRGATPPGMKPAGGQSAGIPATANLTAKGSPLTAQQRQVANTLIAVGQKLGASKAAMEGVIFDAIFESGLGQNMTTNGGGYFGVLGGSTSNFPGTAQQNIVPMATAAYTGGRGYGGSGTIGYAKQYSDPAQIGSLSTLATPLVGGISQQYASQSGTSIAQVRQEAARIVAAATGGGGTIPVGQFGSGPSTSSGDASSAGGGAVSSASGGAAVGPSTGESSAPAQGAQTAQQSNQAAVLQSLMRGSQGLWDTGGSKGSGFGGSSPLAYMPAVTSAHQALQAVAGDTPLAAHPQTDVTKLKGTASFGGTKVAAWIVPILSYAKSHGWRGSVTTGFSGSFPQGGVDVTNPGGLAKALVRSPYAGLLGHLGGAHFSHPRSS